jgi:hypothetical protein
MKDRFVFHAILTPEKLGRFEWTCFECGTGFVRSGLDDPLATSGLGTVGAFFAHQSDSTLCISGNRKSRWLRGQRGFEKIAARFGVDPSTVQRISRPFAESAAA